MKKGFLKVIIFSLGIICAFANGIKENSGSYPNGPVTIICPYSAGGGSDNVCRALAEAAKADFPQGITVENRTGGAGSVGMSYGMHAKPNGQIITMVVPELVMLPIMGNGGDIDYKNFIPLAVINSDYGAITVPADSPYQTLSDLITAAKEKNLQCGNSGLGSIWHMAGVGFEQAANVKFTHVPFDGASAAITALLGHHIDLVSVSYAEVTSQVKAGKLKSLAVLAPSRLDDCPDIPTAKELGFDVAIGTWRGFCVPVGTPDETVKYIYNAIMKAIQTDSFKSFMKNTHNDIDLIDSKGFSQKLETENTYYTELIKELGLNN